MTLSLLYASLFPYFVDIIVAYAKSVFNPPWRFQIPVVACHCPFPIPQQLRLSSVYEDPHVTGGVYNLGSPFCQFQTLCDTSWLRGFSFHTSVCGSCPWCGQPNCIRSQTISRIRHNSAFLGPEDRLHLWWLCTAQDVWGTQGPRVLDRSLWK